MRRLIVLALALVAAVVLAAPAHAAIVVRVEAGFDGAYTRDSHLPVRVRVESDRLVRGTLEARSANWLPRSMLPVEIPGGGEKEFVLLVAPPRGATEVTVNLLDRSGKKLASGSAPVNSSADQELAGLLPGVVGSRPLPGAAPLSVDAGTARFVRIDGRILALGPVALGSLGTIGAAADDVAQLAGAARSGLLGWVSSGGRLLVDAEPGSSVKGLPGDWQPGPGGRAPAGRGEVVLTAGAMSAGRWQGLIEPTGRAGGSQERDVEPDDVLVQSLASASGVSVPRVDRLMFPLLIYALVVGPIAFLVLRARRREELAWIVIPLVAILFTAGSYVWAVASRGGSRVTHATLIETSPAGSWATSNVGTASTGGGRTSVRFPRAWGGAVTALRSSSQEGTTVLTTAEGPEIVVPLNPGQFVRAQASGPADAGGGLRLTVRSDGDRIRGTVANATPFRLESVAVVVGKNVVNIGELRAGAEREWDTSSEPENPHFARIARDVFPNVAAGDPRLVRAGPSGLAYGLWVQAATLGDDVLQPGDAVALGATKDFRLPVSVNGSERSIGGTTLVLGRGHVTREGGRVGSLAVRRERVRGASGSGEPGSDFPQSFGDDSRLVLRFTLDGPMPQKLVLNAPPRLRSLEVWRNGAWEKVAGQEPAQPGIGAIPIPRGRLAVPGPPGGPVPIPAPARPFFGDTDGPEIAMEDYDLPVVERIMYIRAEQERGPEHTEWAFNLKEKA